MALASSAPMLFQLRLRLVNALLKFRTIGTHDEKNRQSTISTGPVHAQSISNERAAACGCTYDCGSAAAMAWAPPAPILFISRLRLVNDLLNPMFNGQKCSRENKFVSVGRTQTKHNSQSS